MLASVYLKTVQVLVLLVLCWFTCLLIEFKMLVGCKRESFLQHHHTNLFQFHFIAFPNFLLALKNAPFNSTLCTAPRHSITHSDAPFSLFGKLQFSDFNKRITFFDNLHIFFIFSCANKTDNMLQTRTVLVLFDNVNTTLHGYF